MLTLQNILDSDSLSTLVAKLNANFSSIALSNGGPQGVRGEQGIPGLPGKQGATGPAGPAGATGPAPGIIPFSTAGTTVTYGPTSALYPQPSYNDLSYDFLVTGPNAWGPLGPTGSGFAIDGQLYFDNNNLGWWKYLAVPDPTPTTDTIGGSPAQSFVESPFYDSASGGNWTGPDWYFYPLNLSTITALTQGVWTADKTNYLGTLTGSLYGGPATGPTFPSQTPYEIANARMNSKFGTVWISSYDGQPQGGNPAVPTGSEGDDSNDTPYIYYWDYLNGPRLSSGIDRSLFKMSIDGPQYFDMMKARAWTDIDGGPGIPIIGVPYIANGGTDIPNDSTLSIQAINAGNHPTYFARPIYNISIDGYAPIQFFTGRNTGLEDVPEENTTLGYLQFTYSPAGSTVPDAKIHLFTTRQTNEFFNSSGDVTAITSSQNTGEAVWDVRRFITSNQYLNMFPQDTSGFTSVDLVSETAAPYAPAYGGLQQRNSWTATNRWQVFQGYHSVFTGQKVVQNAAAGNQNAISSIDTWIYDDRQSWYGTSIFENKPDLLNTQTQQELVRSAGMMVDAKNWGWDSGDWNVYQDRVYIYTSNMVSFDGDSPNSYPNPESANNALLSLPTALFSGTRNVGIGTFTNDKTGMFEPSARMQVHSDWRNKEFEGFGYNTNYTDTLGSFSYTSINKPWLLYTDSIPRRTMKTAAFTIERNSPADIWGAGDGGVFDGTKYEVGGNQFIDWYTRGVFNDILMGAVAPPAREYEDFTAGIESAMATYLRPTSGIRYESFNYDGENLIVNQNPDRNYGWGFRGALRFGTSPYFSGSDKTTPTTDEIGSNANLQNLEYQLSISPLSFSSANDMAAKSEMLSGVGIQNLYPRTRAHFYGKNTYQEFRFDEAYSPGSENSFTSPAQDVETESWGSLASNNQITVDFVGNSYWYNAGIYDYAYDFTVTPTGVIYTTQYSPNARNYPTKEVGIFKRTKSTYHPTNNYAVLTNTPSTINSYGSLHGSTDNGLWSVDKYIGFNAFRDLLGKGDAAGEITPLVQNTFGLSYDRYASNWRIGTEGVNATKENRDPKNGGSLILTDSEGKMGFSFIPAYRDGGERYGMWEQQNVGTREIVDNIKIVFDDKGNIGIGNAPGLDENAYPSLYLNPATGTINYLPNANGLVVDPTVGSPGSYQSLATSSTAWVPGIGDTYGFGVPIGSAQTGFDAAGINAKATQSESIRFEISGEKASTRVGHTPQRRGYGYPGWSSANTTGLPQVGGVTSVATIEIVDNATASFALRYIGITNNALEVGKWQNATHYFIFDNLGRMISYYIEFASVMAWPNGTDLYSTYASFRVPHPRDFAADGPLGSNFPNTVDHPWTLGMTMVRTRNGSTLANNAVIWIPASAAAAELETAIYEDGTPAANVTFAYDELQEAVMRLNNFNLGDGYQLVRADGNVLDTTLVTDLSQAATKAIYDSRTASPKLLITFGAPDDATMNANGISSGERTSLINAGLAPLMKVTTVIESAQNDSALRTYTIPKAANTGGSFMVITDHMGQREKDDPGLVALPNGSTGANRIILEKVVAHEVVRTGQVDDSYEYGFVEGDSDEGFYLAYYPGYELLPINYIKNYGIANSLKTERIMTDPQMQVDLTPSRFGSNVRRDLDSYWQTDSSVYIGPFRDNDTATVESFKKSEIRYRRLNEDYVMFDFNIDLRAVAWNTLQFCDPVEPQWNNHGVTRRILGDATGYPTGNDNLAAYVHSPYAPGHLISGISYYTPQGGGSIQTASENVWVGIDARWVQYIRFSYDVQRDSLSTTEDPHFYERQFGGGPSFGNWNEYRAWYPGTATVGPYISSTIYTEYQFGQDSSGSTPGNGASGYNVTDGFLGSGAWPNATAYQWNTGGTGSSYVTPRDGSPYSVWNSIESTNNTAVYNIVRYWNGRLNDWYMSRWSQHENTSGSFPGDNYDSQTTSNLTASSNRFTPEYNKEFGHPGYLGAGATWRSWQNNESTAQGYIVYPDPYDTYSSPARVNQPWVNQYAYKLLWKSVIPFNYALSYIGQPQFNLYTEHSKLFDDIIQRSFGDKAWNRNGSMQWRVTPSGKGTGTVSKTSSIGFDTYAQTAENVTFVVEIMFDEPIYVSGREIQRYGSEPLEQIELQAGSADGVFATTGANVMQQHIQNQLSFAGIAFDDLPSNAKVSPYSNLTLRGQSVVKYKRTDYSKTTAVVL